MSHTLQGDLRQLKSQDANLDSSSSFELLVPELQSCCSLIGTACPDRIHWFAMTYQINLQQQVVTRYLLWPALALGRSPGAR